MPRTSPAKRSSWMAATLFGNLSGRGQRDAFHGECPSGRAAVAGDREGRDAAQALLPHEPMTSTASAHEPDLLTLSASSEEESFGSAPPTQSDEPWGRVDGYVTGYSFSSAVFLE